MPAINGCGSKGDGGTTKRMEGIRHCALRAQSTAVSAPVQAEATQTQGGSDGGGGGAAAAAAAKKNSGYLEKSRSQPQFNVELKP